MKFTHSPRPDGSTQSMDQSINRMDQLIISPNLALVAGPLVNIITASLLTGIAPCEMKRSTVSQFE